MKWDVDILMADGIEFMQLVTKDEVQEAIRDARRMNDGRRATPVEPWVTRIAAEDALMAYPNGKILSIEIRKSVT